MSSRDCKAQIPRFTPCAYCFQEWANSWDHIKPYSAGGKTVAANLLPACMRCNQLLSNFHFWMIEERRAYIRQELISRGEWVAPASEDPVEAPEEETESLLCRACRKPIDQTQPGRHRWVYCSRLCSRGLTGKRRYGSGQFPMAAENSRKGVHVQRHVNRGIVKEGCALCSQSF